MPNQEEIEQDDAGDKKKKKKKDEMMLIFYPLNGTEFIEVPCSGLLGGPNPDGTFGTFSFNELYKHRMDTSTLGGFSIKLKRGSGKLYARKSIDSTRYEDGVAITEKTTFDLWHKAPRVRKAGN